MLYAKRFLETRRKEEHAICNHRHNQKLLRLGLDITKMAPDNSTIRNLSKRILTDTEKSALSKGLNYCIPVPYLDLLNVQTEFENLYQEIRPFLKQQQKTEFKRILINLYSKFKSSYFHFKNTGIQNLTKEEQLSLKSLKNDQSIIICKPDKGQGVAILDKLDYIAKMEKILSDKTAFMQVNKDDNVSNLEKFQNFLYRLKKNKNLDDTIYQEIRPRAASTPCLYGLPKLHKDNCPLRPILSATGSSLTKQHPG